MRCFQEPGQRLERTHSWVDCGKAWHVAAVSCTTAANSILPMYPANLFAVRRQTIRTTPTKIAVRASIRTQVVRSTWLLRKPSHSGVNRVLSKTPRARLEVSPDRSARRLVVWNIAPVLRTTCAVPLSWRCASFASGRTSPFRIVKLEYDTEGEQELGWCCCSPVGYVLELGASRLALRHPLIYDHFRQARIRRQASSRPDRSSESTGAVLRRA